MNPRTSKTKHTGKSVASSSECDTMINFRMCDEEFVVNIQKVRRISRFDEVTGIPNLPPFVQGTIKVYGNNIAVLDLRKKMGMPTAEYRRDTKVIIMDITGISVGFVVDAIYGMIEVQRSTAQLDSKAPVLGFGDCIQTISRTINDGLQDTTSPETEFKKLFGRLRGIVGRFTLSTPSQGEGTIAAKKRRAFEIRQIEKAHLAVNEDGVLVPNGD